MEDFDLWKVGFKKLGLVILSLEVVCEFGDVVDLDVVPCAGDDGTARTAPAVVVGFFVFTLIFLFLGSRQFKEVLGQCELSVNLLLVETEVLYVELRTY